MIIDILCFEYELNAFVIQLDYNTEYLVIPGLDPSYKGLMAIDCIKQNNSQLIAELI